jgi:hypothetical protein
MNCEIYGIKAIDQAYRILGLGDRRPDSQTFGCFDRYYWHYKQTDFVNARFQESSQFLALLFSYNHPENRFYQNEKIYQWAQAAVDQWTKIQRPDGSFDEYWPFERSFCVTSFTLYAASETCRLLNFIKKPTTALSKAAKWLMKRENPIVMNQMAASAIALRISGEILEDDSILDVAQQRIHRILERQSPSGYFDEYGGYDIGYQTISLSCLAQFYLHTNDNDIKEAMRRGFRFLDTKIEENGSYDYSKTSRKTQYFYPYGFRVLDEWDLLNKHITGLKNNEVINPSWCDDRYCLPLAIDYLQTAYYDSNPKTE